VEKNGTKMWKKHTKNNMEKEQIGTKNKKISTCDGLSSKQNKSFQVTKIARGNTQNSEQCSDFCFRKIGIFDLWPPQVEKVSKILKTSKQIDHAVEEIYLENFVWGHHSLPGRYSCTPGDFVVGTW